MKIVLVTIGSRGDVQPMLALSLALKTSGHDVLLAGPPERAKWAAMMGCPFMPLGSDVTQFIDSKRSAHTLSAAVSFFHYVRLEIREQFRMLPDIIADADLVVGASLAFGLASVAEAINIPYRYIAFTPQLLPSGYHPCPVFKSQRLPPMLNHLGWRWAILADRLNGTLLINHYRRKLGLKPVRDAYKSYFGQKVIVATDRALAEIPGDVKVDFVQTGYIHLRQPAPVRPALERFLSEGPQPIYAGFGSMPRTDQMRLSSVLIKAARLAGIRMVIGMPWGGTDKNTSGEDVFFIRQYPHEALFPRMAAVVHHGGAGTTATAAASGVPQIIVPHILDQYYWGDRVYRAGIGSRTLFRNRLTAKRLADRIRSCIQNTRMKENALAVRDKIRKEDGVEVTVKELLESFTETYTQ